MTTARHIHLVLGAALLVSACTASPDSSAPASSNTSQLPSTASTATEPPLGDGGRDQDSLLEQSESSTTSTESTTRSPSTTRATTTTTTTTTTTEPPATYSAVISEITPEIEARMSTSWREGCPVGLEDLRYLELAHWDYDGSVLIGELVVAASAAEDIATAFGEMFAAEFPIARMELVDEYAADDDLSMAANNTSAFNCREVAWRPGVWSVHSLGLAIDINPLVNPYVSATRLLPPEGAEYADRSLDTPGLIHADSVVVNALGDIGWSWGGNWSTAKDYQHFSSTGR